MNLFDTAPRQVQKTQRRNEKDNKLIYKISMGISNKNTEFDRLRRLAIQELKK